MLVICKITSRKLGVGEHYRYFCTMKLKGESIG